MKLLPLIGSIVTLVGAVLSLQYYTAANSPVVYPIYATLDPGMSETVMVEAAKDEMIDITNAHRDNRYFAGGVILFASGCFVALASIFLGKKTFSGLEKLLLAIATLGIVIFGLLNWWLTTGLVKAFSALANSSGGDPAELGWALTEGFPAMQGATISGVIAAFSLVAASVLVLRGERLIQKTSAAKKVGVVFLGLFLVGICLSQLGRGNSAIAGMTSGIDSSGIDPSEIAQLLSRFLLLSTATFGFIVFSGIVAFFMAITSRSKSS